MRKQIWAGLLMLAGTAGGARHIDAAARCSAAPFGDTRLYLRGSMSGWVAASEDAFRWECDAYVITTELQGAQDFKIADADWSNDTTFAAPGETDATGGAIPIARVGEGGGGNLRYRFDGWHTLRLTFVAGQPSLTVARAAAPAPTVFDRVALSLHHDTRAVADKAPFGAVTAGTKVAFGMDALAGVERATLVVELRRLEGNQEIIDYSEIDRIPLSRSDKGKHSRWTVSYDFVKPGIYGYWFEVVIGGRTYVYGNNAAPVYWTRERGANGVGAVSPIPRDRSTIHRFRQTVYAAGYRVPSWAQDAVYYYIFPERFRNGDLANDRLAGFGTEAEVEHHAAWKDKPYRPGSGDGSDQRYSNDFFGGDLKGIIDKLDYIAGLGVNTIYMTPIFAAASNHKYDTGDYTRIDPAFGTNADFERLTAEASRRGIRVVVDASFNHTGRNSIYFDRYARYPGIGALEGGTVRPESPYADWYRLDGKKADPDDRYVGWTGAKDLPELNEMAPSFRRFTLGAPDSISRQWLKRGAGGWRMDVAPWVPDAYWREWRSAVKAAAPDAVTIAETWFDASKYFLGDTFDGTMNYIFRNTAIDIASGGNAAANYRNIELTREMYPAQAMRASMNLLSTHDTARTLWLLGDRGDDAARTAEAKRRYRLALFMQMTWPGAPTIFYGDEVGLTGGEDPDNRRTYPWADRGGHPDDAMLADFRRLIALRKANPLLARGTLGAPLYADANVVVVPRQLDGAYAIVAINNAVTARTVDVRLPSNLANAGFVDVLTGTAVSSQNRQIRLTIRPLYGTVLLAK